MVLEGVWVWVCDVIMGMCSGICKGLGFGRQHNHDLSVPEMSS